MKKIASKFGGLLWTELAGEMKQPFDEVKDVMEASAKKLSSAITDRLKEIGKV